MKVSGFYVAKNGKLVDEKDVMEAIVGVAKTVLMSTCTHAALPLVKADLPLGLVAHASAGVENATAIADAFDPLISTLQDLAEPFSFGFALKGVFMKMQGKENEGNKVMKNAMYGYLTVQFLPEIYDLLKMIKL